MWHEIGLFNLVSKKHLGRVNWEKHNFSQKRMFLIRPFHKAMLFLEKGAEITGTRIE